MAMVSVIFQISEKYTNNFWLSFFGSDAKIWKRSKYTLATGNNLYRNSEMSINCKRAKNKYKIFGNEKYIE